MIKTVYRKSDLTRMSNVAPGMTFEQELWLNVIPNYGGDVADYAVTTVPGNNFHLELINEMIVPVEDEIVISEQPQTIEEYILDIDFRVCNLELGL